MVSALLHVNPITRQPLKAKKYCDFTGFHTSYQDPKTALRYFNTDFYPYVKTIPDGVKDEYLAIRKANVILK